MTTEGTMFYRVHHAGPRARGDRAFSANNAYSPAEWGSERLDARREVCATCDGSGEVYPDSPCATCDGEGWIECSRGYSCCASARALIRYFDARAGLPRGRVIVEFSAGSVGAYDSDQPECLAVPDGEHVRWITARELRAIAAREEAQQ